MRPCGIDDISSYTDGYDKAQAGAGRVVKKLSWSMGYRSQSFVNGSDIGHSGILVSCLQQGYICLSKPCDAEPIDIAEREFCRLAGTEVAATHIRERIIFSPTTRLRLQENIGWVVLAYNDLVLDIIFLDIQLSRMRMRNGNSTR